MAWAKPKYSRGSVNKAGNLLAANHWDDKDFINIGQMFDVINNWRSSHSYPLLASRMTLTGRARGIDHRAIIAQRLKRLESINTKLRNNENMALSQMQDIGGCRAERWTPKFGQVAKVDSDLRMERSESCRNGKIPR